ncbi:hypothetical protein [Streptomyces sp. NRRL S-495]|uniref:hypothetical protein n=1 Tax=Streptomyces sp. NRRL S-495 TaxID=1609133 RepID=UPI0005F9A25D|nr:hypothetical protein [Streptomyces sp. NRRL S-495]KJY33658.1 hypothetical protein VR45_19010 [Streptomyces sp. NRRL S-495]
MNRDEAQATEVAGGEEVARALAGLVETMETGPAPYPAVLAGGRRRVVRRRTSMGGALALALVAALGGVAAVNGGAGGPGGGTTAVTSSADVSTVLTPAAGGPAATPGAPRDPLVPTRIQVLAGTKDGKPWSVWAALWPAPGKEGIREQARLIWQEDADAGSPWPAPTEEYITRYGTPDADHVVFYYIQDGKRLARSDETFVAPPGSPVGFYYADRSVSGNFDHFWFGAQAKSGADDPLYTVPKVDIGLVPPGVARAVIEWADGVTAEPAILSLGDSEARWIGAAKRGVPAELRLYAADGSLIDTKKKWAEN